MGGPVRRSNFRRRVWLPAVQASVGEPMRFHDLRYTHVAMLIAQGEHPKTIQARLGHRSISTTLDTYGHLFEGLDEAAADRLGTSTAQRVTRIVQLTVMAYTGLWVFCRSRSYGVCPSRPPWGRLKL
jgi:integrase